MESLEGLRGNGEPSDERQTSQAELSPQRKFKSKSLKEEVKLLNWKGD